MGNADELFYSEPLHIVRGEDVWLYDAEGKKYLDVYNNVAHVGHSNPHVVEAITRQAKALNTSTRYLHENIVDLAEKITELMPGELEVCYFVCSGSEANDLALQIARAYTKKQGCLVSENAYHGNTTAVLQMSPDDCVPEKRQDWVQTLPSPKKYQQTEQIFFLMIRRPPRSTPKPSSAASDVYKGQHINLNVGQAPIRCDSVRFILNRA